MKVKNQRRRVSSLHNKTEQHGHHRFNSQNWRMWMKADQIVGPFRLERQLRSKMTAWLVIKPSSDRLHPNVLQRLL